MAVNRAKLLESADKLVRQGKLEEAIRQYMALSEDNPRDVNTINRIGDLYVRLRKNKEAIRQFMRIADFYAGDGFHLKAIAMYKKITKLDPSNIDANERLADLYAKQGLVIEARTQFLSLAEQCLRSGQKPKAIEIYQKIQSMEPDNLKARVILADLIGKEGDPAKAADGFVAAAEDLLERGLHDEALKVLVKAARTQPGRTEIHDRIAAVLKAGDKSPQELVGTLEAMHLASPGTAGYVEMLGDAYLKMGRVSDFQKLAKSAKSGEARVAIALAEARFLVSKGDSEKAVTRLAAAAGEAIGDPGPVQGAALLEEALKIKPESAEMLEKLLDLWTTASEPKGIAAAAERLARLYCGGDEWERASRMVERIHEVAPDHPGLAELREKVNAGLGIGASGGPDDLTGSVPTLDELEKVVELESDAADAGEDQFAGLDAEPDSGADEPEISDETQDAAYSGKSVIQEMRGEPPGKEVDEDFLSEHLTEAEVFLKYGLAEKAREQLQAILDRYPEHVPSLKKMKDIYAEDGRKTDAAGICLRIAEVHRARGEEEAARDAEEQARELDPAGGSPEPVEPAPAKAAAAPEGVMDLELPDPRAGVPRGTGRIPAAKTAGSLQVSEPDELSIELDDEAAEEPLEQLRGLDPEKASQFDFYLEQNLVEEAEEVLAAMERSAPGDPELIRRRALLEDRRPALAPAAPASQASGNLDLDVERAFGGSPAIPEDVPESAEGGGTDEGFFDLAAELKSHLQGQPGDLDAGENPPPLREEASIDEIFKAFRKKVDLQVEEEDYETRYNLGIAYKEMGLLDEAIGEFQYASRDPKLFLECCSILGICFKEKGMTDLAIKWYRKALESTGHSEDRYQGLRYDLGELYVEKGDYSHALSFFSEVYGINSNYRDVALRIRELRKRVG
jgi:tetratricopeptide (TPR) repeat protein